MMRSRLIALSLGSVLLVAMSACTTTANTASFNTAALSSDAAAIAYAVQAIESIPELESHLSEKDKAQVAANSNGTITVATGKDWAKSLGTDLQTLLAIATPIVKVYSPSTAGYMSTVAAMIPLIEALAGVTAAPFAAQTETPELIRARIYQGV
ncbi:hypothetical protein [Gluconobacter kondonii]|uniref:hypothetical protein n=1 Tax=Gluconobacter kondonii TaxID=941463 RepID=UPI001B8B10BD|nr:hypothetical protein [Gluconobacter kondonii]MBS1066431.1 hypothetical protein [Gluconobacter kondonii]MBS1083933.1 hypothetical protein [Gluconobacter kondonii]